MKKPASDPDPLATERDLSGKATVRRGKAGKVAPAAAVEPHNIKVRISIKLDADVLAYFKEQAQQPGALPYQTRINQTLRAAMEAERGTFPGESLVEDDRFVDALAERIRRRL
jgi:uncharacterized protein (DUF4415 family)